MKQLQLDIHYTFGQVKLLETALTHSSYVNEQPQDQEHNERLEFLGDAVLELCVTELLYSMFPAKDEGALTEIRSRMVNSKSLASVARGLRLDAYLRLGKGEEAQGGRERGAILEDAFEALLGAVYLDGGYEAARRIVTTLFKDKAETLAQTASHRKDHKSALQETTQQLWQSLPVYRQEGCSGPEHARVFFVRVELGNGMSFEGEGGSVKKAEQAAAAAALDHLQTLRRT